MPVTQFPYIPQKGAQTRFWKALHPNAPWNHIGFGGPRGGGKSYQARGKAHELCCMMPIHVVLVRRTITDAIDNHVENMKIECKDFIDAGFMSWNGRTNEFSYANGSKFSFRYCSKDADLLKWQGKGYDVIIFEEAGQFTPAQISYMRTTNRTSAIATKHNTNYRPRCVYTFNWGGPGHKYLRRVFWDGYILKKKEVYKTDKGEYPKDYIFIFSSIFDNPKFLEKSPGYLKELLSLSHNKFRADAIGDPDALQGTMFETFEGAHIVDPFLIPDKWPVYAALDPGTKSYCSFGVYTKDPDSEILYKVMHYYESERTIEQQIRGFMEQMQMCPYLTKPPEYIIAGHDAFSELGKWNIGGNRKTWQGVIEDTYGIPVFKAITDRVQGCQALEDALSYEYDYDSNKLITKPKIQFFQGQESTLERFSLLERSEKNPEDIREGEDVEDHDYDETRYAYMSSTAITKYQQSTTTQSKNEWQKDEEFFQDNKDTFEQQEDRWDSYF